MTLQDTFYVIGIIYMGISLLLIIGVIIALLVIRKKVVSIENMIQSKIDSLTSLPARAGKLVDAVKKFAQDGKHSN